MITDLLHITTHQYQNTTLFCPTNVIKVAPDFSGYFFIRVDGCSESELVEMCEGSIEVLETSGVFWKVKSSIQVLQRIREQMMKEEKSFLILYIIEYIVYKKQSI